MSFPFVLSTESTHLLFTIKTNLDEKSFLYFYVLDPGGKLRIQYLLCKPEERLLITEGIGSIGTFSGPIPKGEWTIYLSSFKPQTQIDNKHISFEIFIDQETSLEQLKACQTNGSVSWGNYIKEKNAFTLSPSWNQNILKRKGWYRGDFHNHTTLSDGKMTQKEAVVYTDAHDIDFIFIT